MILAASLQVSTVRRANSCPEMKKSVVVIKDNISKVLLESAEEGMNGGEGNLKKIEDISDKQVQTDVLFPMPYEHLFLSIFPSMANGDNTLETPPLVQEDPIPDGYDLLDRSVEFTQINKF